MSEANYCPLSVELDDRRPSVLTTDNLQRTTRHRRSTMTHRVTLIPGDGIGPEISQATQRVIDATGAKIEWDVLDAGEAAIARTGQPLPPEVVESIRQNKVALKGPITTPVGKGFRSVNVGLRKAL